MSSRIISVKGYGKLKISPDLTIVEFRIEIENKNYEKAYEEYKDLLKRLNDIIKSLGFKKEDLKTKHWDVSPITHVKEGLVGRTKKITTYEISHSLKLEFDKSSGTLSILLSEISKTEFLLDIDIKYGIKDTESVKNQLLKKATIDAKNKAKIMVESIGEELGKLKKINYNVLDLSEKYQMPFEENINLMKCSSDFLFDDFEPENIEFNDDVEVIWEIK